jgi:choline transport protein
LLGPDAAVHIAEEVRDASSVLPKCMVWGYLYNAVLGLITLITLLFTVGTLDDAINAASPFQNAFTNTGSQGLNVFMTLILFLLILSGNITAVTTVSRETWAFARDGGLPFSRWIAKVSSSFEINSGFWLLFMCDRSQSATMRP